MGFLSKVLGAGIKTVLTPVAVLKDVVNIANGDEVDATSNLIQNVVEDLEDAGDEIGEGNLL